MQTSLKPSESHMQTQTSLKPSVSHLQTQTSLKPSVSHLQTQTSLKPFVPHFDVESGKPPKIRCFSFGMLNYIVCFIIPFAMLPLALSKHKETRCLYVILWMILYWMLQPVNIAVTSLLPVAMYPLLGILDANDVTQNYMKDILIMLICDLGIAVAVEHSNLHKRIALKVLLTMGTELKWLLLGLMSSSMFLSMWISYSATTAIMVPIIDAVVGELRFKEVKTVDEEIERTDDFEGLFQTLHKTLLIGVAYSAIFGGTASLNGTIPNKMLKTQIEKFFPHSNEITYCTWMAFTIPGMILGVFATWLILQMVYVPCWRIENPKVKERIKTVITAKYQEIGRMTFHEAGILGLFVLMVLLGTFQQPNFVSGWAGLFFSEKEKMIGQAIPDVLVFILLFAVPAKPWMIYKSPRLLTWTVFQNKMPWGLLLILGGGYAMAEGAKTSGIPEWVEDEMRPLSSLSPTANLIIVSLLATVLAEFLNDAAVALIFLPVVLRLAINFHINPLYLMIPVPLSASYSFILPVATGPNAIIYGTGHVKIRDMILPGMILKTIIILVQLLLIHTLGDHMFQLSTFPSWANATRLISLLDARNTFDEFI